jgi:GTP-binding protein HflX
LVSDTVGFIRKLPHQLVSAFRATLEEVVESDLILHIIDVSDPDRVEKEQVVLEVLKSIGAADHPMLTVYNKADLLAIEDVPANPTIPDARMDGVLVSAVTGEGLDSLVSEIVHHVSPVRV